MTGTFSVKCKCDHDEDGLIFQARNFPVPGGNKYGNLAVSVGEVSNLRQ
jgi:hypothetical protein